MPSDRYASVWTRIGGEPIKMGNLVVTDRECRFSYTAEFIESGLPGLSLVVPPRLIGGGAIVHKSRPGMPLHPRLMAMIPPDTPGNLQRRIFSKVLAKRGIYPAPGIEMDWSLLLLAGRNGIGHLDVFQDDQMAAEWYGKILSGEVTKHRTARSSLWRTLKDEVRQTGLGDDDLDSVASLLGPTPSVGGMITKMLLDIPDKKAWNGDFLVPAGIGADPAKFLSAVVKMEPPHYAGLMSLESLCLDVHRELGFQVPRSWALEIDGLKLLAIERFDRSRDGRPVAFESLLTLFAGGSKNVSTSNDVEWNDVGRWMEKLGSVCNLDTGKSRETLFKRLAVALMTGNGDMHLDNLGIVGGPENAVLAPVYDPSPMRAWKIHDMRMSVPIDFEHGRPVYEQIAATARAFGFSEARGKDLLVWAYETTRDYPERVMALQDVPQERRERLVAVVQVERDLLAKTFGLEHLDTPENQDDSVQGPAFS